MSDSQIKSLLFFDVVSSSLMWNKNPEQMKKSLTLLDDIVKNELNKYKNSYIVKTIGDAYMICFDNWKESYQFAKHLQLNIKKETHKLSVSSDLPFKLRIGIAHGEVVVKLLIIQKCKLKDLFGNTVNTASRMESKVSPVGGIGIVNLTKDPKELKEFQEYIVNDLNKNNYDYEILSFNNECKQFKKELHERSSRLLNNFHYTCRSLDELKGVSQVDLCFKINLDKL